MYMKYRKLYGDLCLVFGRTQVHSVFKWWCAQHEHAVNPQMVGDSRQIHVDTVPYVVQLLSTQMLAN